MANFPYAPGTPQDSSGPLALRPSPASVPPGTLYETTDGNGIYWNDGANWNTVTAVGGGVSGVRSVPAGPFQTGQVDLSGTFVPQGVGTHATQVVNFDAAVRFKRKPYLDLTHPDFGADPSNADNLAAFTAAMAALPNVGGELFLPSGEGTAYAFSATLTINKQVRFHGPVGVGDTPATELTFPTGVPGIVVTKLVAGTGGDYSHVEALALRALAKSGIAHGLTINGYNVTVEEVFAQGFSGDGFHYQGAVPNTNASRARLKGCRAYNNGGDGFHLTGNDCNAGTVETCTAESNTGYGFWDNSFLGNTYIQPHAQGNGLGGYSIGVINGACACTVINGYSEGDQPASHLGQLCNWIGGQAPTFDVTSQGLVLGGGNNRQNYTALSHVLQVPGRPGIVRVDSSGRLALEDRALASIAAGAQAGAAPPAPTATGDEMHGILSWGTGAGATAGIQVVANFFYGWSDKNGTPKTPTVMLIPLNAATAALQIFLDPAGDSGTFRIECAATPLSAQASGTYVAQYLVVG
ncbi:MAG: hypothetical protein ACYDA6_00195 [Solirubrobacteraceae bacterium]